MLSPFQAWSRVAAVSISACLSTALFGCAQTAGDDRQPDRPTFGERQLLSPAQLLGDYAIAGYTEYGVGLTSEEWAKSQIGYRSIIEPGTFKMWDIDIRNPIYKIVRYPKLVEGEVAFGVRRTLTDFWGLKAERESIVVLQVYVLGQSRPSAVLEVIDSNTLWDTHDGRWVLEWKRQVHKQHGLPCSHSR